MVEKLGTTVVRNRWRVVLLAALLTGVAGWGMTQIPLFSSRKVLLPKDTEVLQRLDRFLQKFGSASDLIVVLEGAPMAELRSFATDLADRLRQQPAIRHVSERLDTAFLLNHAYLAIPREDLARVALALDQLKSLPDLASEDPAVAIRRADRWLAHHPPIASLGVDRRTGEQAARLTLFILEEWQRWLESPEVPPRIRWEKILERKEVESVLQSDGYYQSRDGRMLFVFVSPKEVSEEFDALDPFLSGVRQMAEGLRAEYAAAGRMAPRFGLAGLPALLHEEYETINSDVRRIVMVGALGVLLVILFGMRSPRRALVVFVPVLLGATWNTALTLFTVGHLTLITAGFNAILFGVGVDYGIFITSRINELLRDGAPLETAIARGLALSARAVLTAGGATVLIFGCLGTVEFTGFSELGIVAGGGVLGVLVATFFVMPAVFAILKPKRPLARKAPTVEGPEAGAAGRRLPRPVAGAVVGVAVALAGLGAWYGLRIPFDYDVLSMLPRGSESARLQRRMLEESDFQSEVVILTVPPTASGPDFVEARRLSEAAGRLPTVARIHTIVDLFPMDAALRAEVAQRAGRVSTTSPLAQYLLRRAPIRLTRPNLDLLASVFTKALDFLDELQSEAFSVGFAEIVRLLEKVRPRLRAVQAKLGADPERVRERTNALLERLAEEGRVALRVLAHWAQAAPLRPEDLPPAIRGRFFAPDGTMAIYVFPAKSIYDVDFLDELMTDIYRVSPSATGFPTIHQVFSRMAVDSFSNGSLLALGVALFWILVAVRKLWGFLVAALPLLMGLGWMLGTLAVLGVKYNYANMVALPLVMALAVDYGVWFGHRWRELHGAPPWSAVSLAGRAILLAFLTTAAGLGAIMLGRYQGVFSLGVAITVGLCCTVFAALAVGPFLAQLGKASGKS
jgi:predicted RND superfamily exporter protein